MKAEYSPEEGEKKATPKEARENLEKQKFEKDVLDAIRTHSFEEGKTLTEKHYFFWKQFYSQTVFSVRGFEAVEKTASSNSGNSARIYVPKKWAGKKVLVVRVEV